MEIAPRYKVLVHCLQGLHCSQCVYYINRFNISMYGFMGFWSKWWVVGDWTSRAPVVLEIECFWYCGWKGGAAMNITRLYLLKISTQIVNFMHIFSMLAFSKTRRNSSNVIKPSWSMIIISKYTSTHPFTMKTFQRNIWWLADWKEHTLHNE